MKGTRGTATVVWRLVISHVPYVLDHPRSLTPFNHEYWHTISVFLYLADSFAILEDGRPIYYQGVTIGHGEQLHLDVIPRFKKNIYIVIFTHLKLRVTVARHNFKWVKICILHNYDKWLYSRLKFGHTCMNAFRYNRFAVFSHYILVEQTRILWYLVPMITYSISSGIDQFCYFW